MVALSFRAARKYQVAGKMFDKKFIDYFKILITTVTFILKLQ